ncbi:MAG: glycosyltransferase family 2 protein [Bacteriovoracaceae bacterium]|jgi:glycosyltransferase involved in cell wall biosynthesis|nr:glycosyltransferase family 2 protein [Bacteriovoracaceae bacterium]
MSSPFISVIIPTYNRSSIVLRALKSVLDQTYTNFEVWIVDDGSTDESFQVINWYINKNQLADKVHLLKTTNRGVSAARNEALKKSSGEWIALLDSDDEWMPDKLQSQIDYVAQNPQVPLVHGEEIWIRNGTRVNAMRKHKKFGGKIFEKCLPLCLISPSASMIRRSVLADMNGFDESFTVCEDYDLWLKITSQYEVGFIEKPLIRKFGGHSDQLSRQYKAMDYYRVKSMDGVYKNGNLKNEWKVSLKKQLIRKCEILLKGYKKYQNFENFDEISGLKKEYHNLLVTHEA